MYISGVPGTGKTATVTQVIKKLQSASLAGQLPKFLYIEINGMRLTDPKQAYVQIYQQIFQKNERVSADVAFKKLDRYFNAADSKKKTTVLLVDEVMIFLLSPNFIVARIFSIVRKVTNQHTYV